MNIITYLLGFSGQLLICCALAAATPQAIPPSDQCFTNDAGDAYPFPTRPIASGSAEESMLNELIAMIECVDAQKAQEMRDTLTSEPGEEGGVQIVELDVPPGPGPGGRFGSPRGFADSNTLGLDFEQLVDGDQTLAEMATVLVHEFRHVQEGRAAGTMTDPNIGEAPSQMCHHVSMVADMVDLLAEFACALPDCTGDGVNCSDIAEAIDLANDYYDKLGEATGQDPVDLCGQRAADMRDAEVPWECCILCGGTY